MTPSDAPRHERTLHRSRGSRPPLVIAHEATRNRASTWPRDAILLALAAVVIALAVSGAVAVAHGAPLWLLVAGAVGGAVVGIGGGRFILHRLVPASSDASSASVIDLRSRDGRVDGT